MTSIIKVNPYSVNSGEEKKNYGEETGTPEYYLVLYTLEKYLGKENISVSWDYRYFFYEIKLIEEKEKDYIKIIESIKEPFSEYNVVSHKKSHLIFEVINK